MQIKHRLILHDLRRRDESGKNDPPLSSIHKRLGSGTQDEPALPPASWGSHRDQWCSLADQSDGDLALVPRVVALLLWHTNHDKSLRDIAEMFLERGFPFTHEAIREWEARFAPLITNQLRAKRRGQAGSSWYVDETYSKVHGKWCYLYRAIDRDGNLIDSYLSEKRDMTAAKCFFQQAIAVVGSAPKQVTTDGHLSYPRAIRETMGCDVLHRKEKYLNNRLEQDHRGVKQRYYPMKGFGTFEAAARFCCAFDELRNYLRPRCIIGTAASLLQQRLSFLQRLTVLKTLLQTAS